MAQKSLGNMQPPMMITFVHLLLSPLLQWKIMKTKPNFLSLLQQNQFGGSTSEDAG
jgi:hypothetical protein